MIPSSLFAHHGITGLLPLTNTQVLGPFYPLAGMNANTVIPEIPADFDLVQVRTQNGLLPSPLGQILHFNGQVLNREGHSIRGAVVELWNADANGWYIDPDSEGPENSQRDVNFQGFGSTVTSEHGAFSFRTIRPAPYPLGDEISRASHLHVVVKVRGAIRLVTQLYFSDELTTWLAQDPIHELFDPSDPGNLTDITPNLITPVTTEDHLGNTVISGHKNLVINEPSELSADFNAELSKITLDRFSRSVTMKITPGKLVDIDMSHNMTSWVPIAQNQSAIFGQTMAEPFPPKTFFRARTLPVI